MKKQIGRKGTQIRWPGGRNSGERDTRVLGREGGLKEARTRLEGVHEVHEVEGVNGVTKDRGGREG